MALSARSLAGPGYIILNILRAMNLIGLLAVVAASMVSIVKTDIVSRFFFFDAASHVLVAGVAMFLIMSELSLFAPYFAHYWPLLSPDHGFVTLGGVMIALGVAVLGSLNEPARSREKFGLAFWRVTAAAGILVIVLGGLNVIASYIFRSRALYITARHVRSDGAITLHTPRTPATAAVSSLKSPYGSTRPPLTTSLSTPSTSSASPLKPLRIRTSFAALHPPSPPRSASPAAPRDRTTARFSRPSPLRALASPFRRAGDALLPLFHRGEERGGAGPAEEGRRDGEVARGTAQVRSISGPMNVNPQFAHLVQPERAKCREEGGRNSRVGGA